jgi:hypothetical protein
MNQLSTYLTIVCAVAIFAIHANNTAVNLIPQSLRFFKSRIAEVFFRLPGFLVRSFPLDQKVLLAVLQLLFSNTLNLMVYMLIL